MMKWREVLIYLLFVVLAAVIWYGRALRAPHETTVPVQVQYVGIPRQVITNEPLPETIKVTLRDAGMRLRAYHQNPLQITVDLTGRFTSKSGELRVSSDLLRTAVQRQLQGTTALQKIAPEQIHTTYYTQQSKKLPIHLRHRIRCASGFQLSGEPVMEQTSVVAYGANTALDSLTHIQSQVLQLSDLSDSATCKVQLITPPAVRLSQQTISVRVPVERYSERIANLSLRVEGVPEGRTLHLFPQQVRVTMHVSVSHWSQVDDKDIEAVCHYADSLELLPVELKTSNPYVSNLRATPDVVEYIVEN